MKISVYSYYKSFSLSVSSFNDGNRMSQDKIASLVYQFRKSSYFDIIFSCFLVESRLTKKGAKRKQVLSSLRRVV